jgi:two-component system sensor histidine kinase KdpD
MDRGARPNAQALLAELGFQPRLTIYLAGAPGAGKTYRLLSEAQFQRRAGRRVAIGWVETKGRPGLDELAADIPRIPLRRFEVNGATYEDFDVDAAIASDYETIVLDELAHSNPAGATHAKRWQDALALRDAGKSVMGAFNIQHLETVALTAERIIGQERERRDCARRLARRAGIALAQRPDRAHRRRRTRGARCLSGQQPADDARSAAADGRCVDRAGDQSREDVDGARDSVRR